jgi:hypothetical protein
MTAAGELLSVENKLQETKASPLHLLLINLFMIIVLALT